MANLIPSKKTKSSGWALLNFFEPNPRIGSFDHKGGATTCFIKSVCK